MHAMTEERAFSDAEWQRELALQRYIEAFDRGDLDGITDVLAQAETDPELDRRLAGVNAALHADAGLQPVEEQARLVRRLLVQHLPSGLPREDEPPAPLTVGDVAAKLQAERAAGPAPVTDRDANARLLGNLTPLPERVTTGTIARLAEQLGVAASTRYWEAFRRAATILGMARQHGEAQLAAARRQQAPRRTRPARREQPTEGHGDEPHHQR
jgi:hypothetical protein